MDTMNKVTKEAGEYDYCCRKHHEIIVSTYPVIFERVLCRSDGSLNSGCGWASTTIRVNRSRGAQRRSRGMGWLTKEACEYDYSHRKQHEMKRYTHSCYF